MSFLGLSRFLTQDTDLSPAGRPGSRRPPRCIWLTGLPGAGKTTLARALQCRLRDAGAHAFVLDGDAMRTGLCRDLGFSEADRIENVRRVAEVARLMFDAGLIVIVALVSPFREHRQAARKLFSDGDFVEVFVDTPAKECERRDPKGMYARARRGELNDFTGIGSRYERPERPELRLDAGAKTVEEGVDGVLRRLE
jgi:bifunctional enzyme CysN/CysC